MYQSTATAEHATSKSQWGKTISIYFSLGWLEWLCSICLILILGQPGHALMVVVAHNPHCKAHFKPLFASHLPTPKSWGCTAALSIKALGSSEEKRQTCACQHSSGTHSVQTACWVWSRIKTAFKNQPFLYSTARLIIPCFQ